VTPWCIQATAEPETAGGTRTNGLWHLPHPCNYGDDLEGPGAPALIPLLIEVTMNTLKWQAFRVLMALSTLAAIALVLEAGRRW
jgi:hypothetical protein